MPQTLACQQGWRGEPHAYLQKLGSCHGPTNNLRVVQPRESLNLLEIIITLIISLHGSLNLAFLSPERYKSKRRCGGAHPQTGLARGTNAGRSSGTSDSPWRYKATSATFSLGKLLVFSCWYSCPFLSRTALHWAVR